MRSAVLVLVGIVVGCDGTAKVMNAAVADAPIANDAELDAPSDAPSDAELDAPSDALVSTSPRCTTTPSILLDVRPKTLGNIARAGSYLYATAYQYSATAPPSDAVIITIDLTTGLRVGNDQPTARPVVLWSSGTAVYGSDYAADGTVWQLVPGQAPVPFLTHLPVPGVPIVEGGYLYYVENAYNSADGVIKRRPLAGGAVDTVFACEEPRELMIDGATLYCVGRTTVQRGLKAGGSTPQSIGFLDSYPFASAVLDGASIYYVQISNTLYEQPLFGSVATAVQQTNLLGSRYGGLAVASDAIYVVDTNWGLLRIDRSTYTPQWIVSASSLSGDPVLWNDHLYYQAPDPQLPFTSYVMQCVD